MGLPRALYTARPMFFSPPEGKNAQLRRGSYLSVAVPRAWKLILLPGFFIVDTDRLSFSEPNNYQALDRLDLASRTTDVTFFSSFCSISRASSASPIHVRILQNNGGTANARRVIRRVESEPVGNTKAPLATASAEKMLLQ